MTEDEDDAPATPAARKRLTASRKQVVDKLWRAARRQLAAHEEHLAGLPAGAGATEADAKALATLARTVRELVAIDTTTGGKPADEPHAADGIRHVAALRAELARRLEALAAQDEGEAGQAPAAGRDG